MDMNELNKKQLILLTLLITFVVSIATGIITVSLMKQMPTSVPQTINNVIQRTIEKVSSPTVVSTDTTKNTDKNSLTLLGDSEILIPIFQKIDIAAPSNTTGLVDSTKKDEQEKELGQGIIISDVGLILVDSSILNESQIYKVTLNKTDFDATILKKFSNGFSVLKITSKVTTDKKNTTETKTDVTTPSVDKIQ
jgi:hypothetical protein